MSQTTIHRPALGSALSFFPDLDKAELRERRALVMTGYGLNCEAESCAAFEMLGVPAERKHIGEILESPATALQGYQFLAFIGGFSFGDHVAAGRVLANRLRSRLSDALSRYVDDGGFAIGMCNGFQVMVKLGLLPGAERRAGESIEVQRVSLISNARRGYRNAWVRLGVDPNSSCVFTRGISEFECPSRHAEGRFVFESEAQIDELEARGCVPVYYLDAENKRTEQWPHNPNGSQRGIAGLCDPTGRVFGLMPHPEAYLYPENHPRWRAQRASERLPKIGAGLQIFANAVRASVRGATGSGA